MRFITIVFLIPLGIAMCGEYGLSPRPYESTEVVARPEAFRKRSVAEAEELYRLNPSFYDTVWRWAVEDDKERATRPQVTQQDTSSDDVEYLEVSRYLNVSTLAPGKAFRTRVSWYGPGFHGKKTANGEVYNQYGVSAASRVLPTGALVEVFYPKTRRAVTVRINDRGPYVSGRDLDLSEGAAVELGMKRDGVADVVVRIVSIPSRQQG